MTKSLNDRARDNWELLIAIADIAGGEWSERARAACQELSNIDIEQESDGILLLYDIRTIFSDKEVDKIFTEDLKKVLVTMDDRPWTEYISSWSITPRQIAKLLKPFGIRPKQMRIGATSKKGYELAWFADAFARYLDPYPPSQSETTKQTNENNDFREDVSETRGKQSESQNETPKSTAKAVSESVSKHVSDNSHDNPLNAQECFVVSDKSGKAGKSRQFTPEEWEQFMQQTTTEAGRCDGHGQKPHRD